MTAPVLTDDRLTLRRAQLEAASLGYRLSRADAEQGDWWWLADGAGNCRPCGTLAEALALVRSGRGLVEWERGG